ncbi:transcriptional regulator, LuxR family [Ostertagia ostertagi]
MTNNKMQDQVRLATADDHTIVRTGLQVVLELKFGIGNIYEAASCAETLSILKKHQPTHLIVDMMFKDGNVIEILPTIKSLAPDLKIMVYSMLPTEIYLPTLQRFGINHYMPKDSTQEEIITQLGAFIRGYGIYGTQEVIEQIVINPFASLSPREFEVLHYLLSGETLGFAAAALNLHKNTVFTLKSRIMEKTGVKNLKGLIDMAILHNYKFN